MPVVDREVVQGQPVVYKNQSRSHTDFTSVAFLCRVFESVTVVIPCANYRLHPKDGERQCFQSVHTWRRGVPTLARGDTYPGWGGGVPQGRYPPVKVGTLQPGQEGGTPR